VNEGKINYGGKDFVVERAASIAGTDLTDPQYKFNSAGTICVNRIARSI
jgi:hypothetical protein